MDDVIELLAKVFKLSEQDRVELLPSGKQRTFYNRVGWARTYLKKAGLVETPGVGKVRITERGIDVLKKNPTKIDRKFLMQFPEFIEFQKLFSKTISVWMSYTYRRRNGMRESLAEKRSKHLQAVSKVNEPEKVSSSQRPVSHKMPGTM